jgi:hypothetical protein
VAYGGISISAKLNKRTVGYTGTTDICCKANFKMASEIDERTPTGLV